MLLLPCLCILCYAMLYGLYLPSLCGMVWIDDDDSDGDLWRSIDRSVGVKPMPHDLVTFKGKARQRKAYSRSDPSSYWMRSAACDDRLLTKRRWRDALIGWPLMFTLLLSFSAFACCYIYRVFVMREGREEKMRAGGGDWKKMEVEDPRSIAFASSSSHILNTVWYLPITCLGALYVWHLLFTAALQSSSYFHN